MTDETRDHLEKVRSHLRDAAAAGDEAAAELAEHVDAYLGGEQGDQEHGALIDRLREGVLRFEVSHPTLSHAVQGVVDSMTASGI